MNGWMDCWDLQMGSNPVLVQRQADGMKERLLAKGESAQLADGDVFFMLPGVDSLRFDVRIEQTTPHHHHEASVCNSLPEECAERSAIPSKKRKMPTTFEQAEGESERRSGKQKDDGEGGGGGDAPIKKQKLAEAKEGKPKPTKSAAIDMRPKCKYGKACYRKNSDHLKAFSHVFDDDEEEQGRGKEKEPAKPAMMKQKKWEPEKERNDDEEEEIILAGTGDDAEQRHDYQPEIPASVKAIRYTTPSHMRWVNVEDRFFVLDGKEVKPSAKIASFDMDSTLIVSKSGRVFAQGRSDWQWMYDCIPNMLRKLHKSGFKIVIFTNQGGIKNNPSKAEEIKGKITDIYEDLGVPFQAFIAGGSDHWRKPSPDMWWFLCHHCTGGLTVDMDHSFYCGDAAGRVADPVNGRYKSDFSCGDRKFAANIGLDFHTPEAYFLKEREADFEWSGVNPKSLYMAARTQALIEGDKSKSVKLTSDSQELVVFVGFPASGKSTFAERYFVPKGYVRVNQDTLKSKDRCVKACAQALDEGKSVVIDNTNPSADVRAEYLAQAKKRGIPARCFYFTTPKDVAQHLNQFRERLTDGERKRVPDMGYNIYTKNFQEPKVSEGFREVKKVNFVPRFESKREERLFLQFTSD